MLKRIGIIANIEKPGTKEVLTSLVEWLEAKRAKFALEEGLVPLVGRKELAYPREEVPTHSDMIIALGGDGTLLAAARAVGNRGTPILGVNLGRLGFLTELKPKEIFPTLERIWQGNYSLEERMVLRVVISSKPGAPIFYALNDLVIDKGSFSRVIQLETFLNGESLSTFSADGLIISTPTGSTAYSLSAGGPIINPRMEAIIITPICPHSLSVRPMVISQEETFEVAVYSDHNSAMLTIDGQVGYELSSGDRVRIVKGDYKVTLVHSTDQSFYQVLREKLKWGLEPGFEG